MKRVVTLGEIMARLAAPGHQRFQQAMPGRLEVTFAGAEASVAASIAHLGGAASFVTALPDHAIADACVANLRGVGVDTRHIVRTSEGRLGIYYLETGAGHRPGQVIYDRQGASVAITPPEAYDWSSIFADAGWLLVSGITPALSLNALKLTQTAFREASRYGVRTALDANYRSKLWRWQPGVAPRELATRTLRELLVDVDLFIGGREEAALLVGAEDDGNDLEALSRTFTKTFPRVKQVAMTLREGMSASHQRLGGFIYDAAQSQAWLAPCREGRYEPYSIETVVDRLGTGDAFTAGLLLALVENEQADLGDALAFATAAGCLAHTIEGDYNYCSRAEIEEMVAGGSGGRVRR